MNTLAAHPLLRVEDLRREYALPRTTLRGPRPVRHALDGVSLELHPGQTLGIVGESGSGKSTLARILAGLDAPTSGTVAVQGRAVDARRPRMLDWLRREVQMVFQDPASSLDPRMTVGRIVDEPLACMRWDGDHDRRIDEVLEVVGLGSWARRRLPHELSGGQQQRVAIARAIAPGPRLLIGDELVSALDVTVRREILELLCRLRDSGAMSLVLVSHDLGVVDFLCTDVVVLRAGRLVESGTVARVFSAPREDYTRRLIEAVPRL